MSAQCPKCGSKNTYEIGRDYGCRMCGKQFPKEGVTPIVVTKVFNERKKDMPEEIKKYPSGKKGICINCRREKFIADKFGRCDTCSASVRGLEMGTTEYIDALIAVKARLADPNRKRVSVVGKKISKNKFKKYEAAEKNNLQKACEYAKMPGKLSLDMTVKEVALTGIPKIIQQMRDERADYLAEAEKLGKAINLLESLQ